MRVAIVVAGVGAAGCAEPTPELIACAGVDTPRWVGVRDLADLPGLEAFVRVGNGGPLDALRGAQVRLRWEPSFGIESYPLEFDGHRRCPLLDKSITASIGEFGLSKIDEPGWLCQGPTGPLCRGATLEVEVPAEVAPVSAVLMFGDHSLHRSVDLGDALVDRSAVPDGDVWRFARGARIHFRWMPASDLVRATRVSADLSHPGVTSFSWDPAATFDAAGISITMPDVAVVGALTIVLGIAGDGLDVGEMVTHDTTIE